MIGFLILIGTYLISSFIFSTIVLCFFWGIPTYSKLKKEKILKPDAPNLYIFPGFFWIFILLALASVAINNLPDYENYIMIGLIIGFLLSLKSLSKSNEANNMADFFNKYKEYFLIPLE